MIIPPKYDTRILQFFDKYKILNSKGTKFEWYKHPFLVDPLCDWSQVQGVNKCAQVGWSETMIVKALFAAMFYKLNIIYTLPSDSFIENFVPPKVDKIVDMNPVFKHVSGKQTLKKIRTLEPNEKGNKDYRYIYFMGAHNAEAKGKKSGTAKGIAISADIKIHDEASRSDESIILQMKSRLADSLYKAEWYFDNPNLPNQGADAIYRNSDQKHWFIRCPHCNYPQYLAWARLDKMEFVSGTHHTWIDVERMKIICGKCRKGISDEARLSGEWVRKKRDKEISGYWLNQLCYVDHTVKELYELDENPKVSRDFFNNFVLGLPYIGSDVNISREHITNNLNGDVNLLHGNAMGIDQGKVKWYVIGNKQGIFKVGYTESWEEIEFLFNKYNCTAVCDALPFPREPKRMANKYRGRFFRAYYKPEKNQSEYAKFSPKTDLGAVLIKRNEMIDNVVDKIVTENLPIQAPLSELEDFINHWTAMNRIVEMDAEMNQRFNWLETGPDHLVHATIYMQTALLKANIGETVIGNKQGKKTDIARQAVLVDNERIQAPSIIEDALKHIDKKYGRYGQ